MQVTTDKSTFQIQAIFAGGGAPLTGDPVTQLIEYATRLVDDVVVHCYGHDDGFVVTEGLVEQILWTDCAGILKCLQGIDAHVDTRLLSLCNFFATISTLPVDAVQATLVTGRSPRVGMYKLENKKVPDAGKEFLFVGSSEPELFKLIDPHNAFVAGSIITREFVDQIRLKVQGLQSFLRDEQRAPDGIRKKPKRGAPAKYDPAEDARIFAAWESPEAEHGGSIARFAETLGRSDEYIRRAIDRHKNRQRRPNK